MKKIAKILWDYNLFFVAGLTLIAGLILQITKHSSIAHWVLAVVAIIEVLPLLWDMWQDVRIGKYGIDILAATAIITSVIMGQYWAGIVVVIMLTGGEALENYAEHRAKNELRTLLSHAPQKALLLRKGKTNEVKVAELKINDRVLINAGELVPADAKVIEGQANFDESSLTGESLPRAKQAGDRLLSGSINLDGSVTAQVLATAEDSQYQQIIRLVRGAAAAQAPFVRLADRYSIPFTFFAYGIAVGAWVLSGQSVRFLEVIIVATPCPLILAAPIALISGMARASRYGVIVKTGSALERLAEAKAIAFDKTGTLTYGQLKVSEIKAFGKNSQSTVLQLAASLEHNSNHVIARAINQAAVDKKIKLAKVKRVQEIAGKGLKAELKGESVLAGNFSYIEEAGVNLPAKFNVKSIEQTAIHVAMGNEMIGYINLSDEVRDEAQATIQSLQEMGVKQLLMLTGDNKVIAEQTAKELYIDDVRSGLLPADKIHAIEGFKNRPLIFVGDGVNDAPALTAADVGIALGARGSAAATESADIVILHDDLSYVAIARSIARRSFKIARQSILIGIGLSFILMAIFATGKLSPLTGAVLQEIVDVFVIFNALRAHLIKVDL